MKKRITLQGCDGQTWIEINMSANGLDFLQEIANKLNATAEDQCNPQMKITEAGAEYNKFEDKEYKF
jgi:hypothetical protein